MSGSLRLVVDRAFDELWQPLTNYDDCPANVFGETYAGVRPFLREPTPEFVRDDDGTIRDYAVNLNDQMAVAMSDSETAEHLLTSLSKDNFESEADALRAISSTYSVLLEVATEDLASNYLNLLKMFVDRYNLMYYVDENAALWISFSGLATALFGQIRFAARGNRQLRKQFNAFEHALAECLADPVESRIMTAIQKQCNVLEAIGSHHHLVSGNKNTLSSIVKQVDSWPHESLREATRLVYEFASDYPGIRHGNVGDSALRDLDLRDLAGVAVSLVGLGAYLTDAVESQVGSAIQGDLAQDDAGVGATAPWSEILQVTASTS